jgi:hypothetical protein
VGFWAIAAEASPKQSIERINLDMCRCMIFSSVSLESKTGQKQFGRQINGKFQTVLLKGYRVEGIRQKEAVG